MSGCGNCNNNDDGWCIEYHKSCFEGSQIQNCEGWE